MQAPHVPCRHFKQKYVDDYSKTDNKQGGFMKKRFLCTTALIIGLGIPVLVHGESGDSSFSVQSAVWDANRERLTVRVNAEGSVQEITALYNNHTYTLKKAGRNRNYSLTLNRSCYADSIVLSADGYRQTAQVTSINGSPEGNLCTVPTPPPAPQSDLVVIANNDLGMHCACPGGEYFLLLPPFNTLRAQVIERGPIPKLLGAEDHITVKYDLVQNTDESLKADPYFASWIDNMPKYGFGEALRPDGRIQGLTGATLDGEMQALPEGIWEVTGVPAFPDVSNNSTDAEKIMTDPLGGPNRNPYITAQVSVYDSTTGDKLAETSTVVPVAFGGCCSCHLELTKNSGMDPTPANSFALMGSLHQQDSGINFAEMDPDGDGTPGPIRCSACHLDPAMGESVAPGYPGYPTSKYTFSNVLHRWHVENPAVLQYNQNLATDCYACHPGNNIGCFRGLHENSGLWCTDCHGDLNTRVTEGQVDQPWSGYTLPKCIQCHGDQGEGNGLLDGFGGYFLNSRGHVGSKVLCSTCHGSPHSLYPSNLPADNIQPMALQGSESAIGRCDVCHTDKGSQWAKPPHEPAGANAPTTGGSTGGSTIDPATELTTTCLNCHGDRSSQVSCSNSKWTSHDGTRVNSEVYAAVTAYLTGSVCGSGGSTGGSIGGSTIDPATELTTTCLNCHGDRSSQVNCSNSKWTSHDGTRVSSEVYDAVTAYLTGSVCGSGGSTGGSTGGDDTSSGVPADHTDREGGALHKPGKEQPYSNGCTDCHGSNLRGGIAPSCYSCHGKEWY
jgi:hypothetical protein